MSDADSGPVAEGHPLEIPVFIDGHRYLAHQRTMDGIQIRHLVHPPIPEDRDLWLDRDGGLDELVEDATEVRLHPDIRFFTVPKVINPGATGASSH
jgi:hypothetical protein